MPDIKKQIFFWFGDNDFEIYEKMNQWRELFQKKYTGFNVVSFDLSEAKSKDFQKELKNALQVDSLFGSNKLIVLKNFLGTNTKLDKEVQDLLTRACEKLPGSFFLVFAEFGQPDRRGKIFKAIKDAETFGSAEMKEFIRPQGNLLSKWIADRAKKHGANIFPDEINLLIALVGADLWQIEQELIKLANYKQAERVTKDDINLLVKGKYNDDIFGLMDAISAKNKVRALKLFQDQIDLGANEVYLLTMLIRQFRILWQIKEMVSERPLPPEVIAKELAIHPFVVRKAMDHVRTFNLPQLKAIYKKLLDCEIQVKTRSVNFEALFDLVIVNL